MSNAPRREKTAFRQVVTAFQETVRDSLDEDTMTSASTVQRGSQARGEHDARARVPQRQKLGLLVRTIRISPQQVVKLTGLGYLDFNSRGDESARESPSGHISATACNRVALIHIHDLKPSVLGFSGKPGPSRGLR